MESPNGSLRKLRHRVFSECWPLDNELLEIGAQFKSHSFLQNPSGQLPFIYLTRFVKAATETELHKPFDSLSVLDWGCGKGHVSKLIGDLQPGKLVSCDIVSERGDSAFRQQIPIIERKGIKVQPLEHESRLPFAESSFDVVLSFGVLEHVSNDRDSLGEIARVLKPGGLFFCFHLPTKLSWTQFVSRSGGDNYHDRLYTSRMVGRLLSEQGLKILDQWYRGLLPKNRIRYPKFRLWERLDQFATEYTPLRYFATNIEFVCTKAMGS